MPTLHSIAKYVHIDDRPLLWWMQKGNVLTADLFCWCLMHSKVLGKKKLVLQMGFRYQVEGGNI